MIRKEDNLYYVYNKEGTKRLSKGFETEEEAVRRLQEIEFLKTNDTLPLGMKDAAVSFNTSIDERTGFMKVEAVIARTGIQKYLPIELGDEGNDPIGVFRSEEEVTHPESLDSFTNIPITDNHPSEMVDINNHDKYAKGSISRVDVVQLGNGITALKTQSIITDKSLIESIQNGKKELSVGYENILVQRDGEYNGDSYKYVQTKIRANHVAVVDAGRCGGICKLMIDNSSFNEKKHLGDATMKIVISGEEYDVPDAVANAYNELKAKVEGMDEGEDKTEAMDKLQATVDTLTVANADMKKQLDDTDTVLAEKVTAKVALLGDAKALGVECEVTDSDINIKKAIVKHHGMDVDGKSEAYLDACIEIKKQDVKDADTRKQNAHASVNKVGDEYKPKTVLDADEIGNKEI